MAVTAFKSLFDQPGVCCLSEMQQQFLVFFSTVFTFLIEACSSEISGKDLIFGWMEELKMLK